jgi:hypothetical protein
MRRLIAFERLTLDGCYASADGDLDWAHRRERDGEWDAFVAGNAGSGGELVFGRRTCGMGVLAAHAGGRAERTAGGRGDERAAEARLFAHRA